MIKKILLLLIFSVSFLTSAQEVNVAEIDFADRETQFHVYFSEHSNLFEYPADATVTTSSFTVGDGILTIGNTRYTMSESLDLQATIRMNELGTYGLFFLERLGPSWDAQSGVDTRFYLPNAGNVYAAFEADSNWNFGPVTQNHIVRNEEGEITSTYTSQSNLWVFDNGCYRYEVVRPLAPGNRFDINHWAGEKVVANYQALPSQATDQDVINYINNHLAGLPDCANACINIDSPLADKFSLLNSGRTLGSYTEGVTDWLPSLGTDGIVWTYQDLNDNGLFDQIIEREGNFILYKDVAGDAGGLPPATGTYSCLADLVAAL